MHDGGFTFNHLSRWEYPDFWFRRFVPRAMVVVGSERSPLGERQRGGGPPQTFPKVCFTKPLTASFPNQKGNATVCWERSAHTST